MAQFDVVVCGLGAMGSAALYHLARRGQRVLGIERYEPGHDRGSSHGATRIIRLGYFEHPSYVPLLRRAYALWHELDQQSGRRLVHRTGIVEIGPPRGSLIKGTLASAHQHDLEHELLAAPELMRRFAGFELPAEYIGVFQPDGGWVAVEPSLHALVSLAQGAGAEVRSDDRVRAIEQRAHGVRVHTAGNDTFDAAAAVVCVGPWTPSLIPAFSAPLRVTRQVTAWFEIKQPLVAAIDGWPVFMIESRHGLHYGIPPEHGSIGAGIKVARHHHRNEVVDPDDHDRAVTAEDEALIRAVLADHIPGANGRLVAAKTCLYTVTPDGDFLIDHVPGASRIIVASPCSGHGFKFAPVIGEILADLAVQGETRHNISRFGLRRFQ
jgi:sarcosine oxidase